MVIMTLTFMTSCALLVASRSSAEVLEKPGSDIHEGKISTFTSNSEHSMPGSFFRQSCRYQKSFKATIAVSAELSTLSNGFYIKSQAHNSHRDVGHAVTACTTNLHIPRACRPGAEILPGGTSQIKSRPSTGIEAPES